MSDSQKKLANIIPFEENSISDDPSDLLSRDDILRRIKTITADVKTYKKQRLKAFFPPSALKSMLEPTAPSKLRKEQRRSSQFLTYKVTDTNIPSSENYSIEEEQSSSFSSAPDSDSSESNIIPVFPKIDLVYALFFEDLEEARRNFDSLDAEFIEKARIKLKPRSNQSILPGSNTYTLTACRSYVKVAKDAYEGEVLGFTRCYVSVNLEEFTVQPSAREKVCDLKLNVPEIKEIIDLDERKTVSLVYLDGELDKSIVLNPITPEDYTKWSNTLKNISKIRNLIYKTEGELPRRIEEEVISPLKHRFTVYPRSEVISNQPIEEDSEHSLETDPDASEPSNDNKSEKSWDFNFDELDRESRKNSKFDVESVTSEENPQPDEEKIRSLTVLASLGKSEGLVNLLTKGGLFLKYGRWGKPHVRHILVTGDLKFVEWWHVNKNKASGQMVVINIISVQKGRLTKNFHRFKDPDRENMSFSLICKSRSIDLELTKDNKIPVDVWVLAFDSLLKQLFTKDQVVRYITKNSSLKQ